MCAYLGVVLSVVTRSLSTLESPRVFGLDQRPGTHQRSRLGLVKSRSPVSSCWVSGAHPCVSALVVVLSLRTPPLSVCPRHRPGSSESPLCVYPRRRPVSPEPAPVRLPSSVSGCVPLPLLRVVPLRRKPLCHGSGDGSVHVRSC